MAVTQKLILAADPGNIGTKIYTGNTEESRRIYETLVGIDFVITGIAINITSIDGLTDQNPGIVRVYQEGSSAYATMEVKRIGSDYQPANLLITGMNGARKIIVDAWDPSGKNNICSFKGTITLRGKPYIKTEGATEGLA